MVFSKLETPAHNAQRNPLVVYDGTNSLVTWSDSRTIPVFGTTDLLSFGSRVDTNANVLNPGGVLISSRRATRTLLRIGARVLALGHDDTGVIGQWLDKTGATVVKRTPRVTPQGFAKGSQVVAGSDGNVVLLLYSFIDQSVQKVALRVARFDLFGRLLDPNPATIVPDAAESSPVAVAWDGSVFYAIWKDGGTAGRLRGMRISADGQVLDKSATFISPPEHLGICGSTLATAAGGGFLVVWANSSRGIFAMRLDTAGKLLGSKPIVLSDTPQTTCSYPVAALGGKSHLVVWQSEVSMSGPTSLTEVVGRRLDAAGKLLDKTAIPIARASASNGYPDLDYDGTNFMVAHVATEVASDTQLDGRNIRVTRVSPGGMVLDKTGVLVSVSSNAQFHPSAAWTGSAHVVAWRDDRNFADKIDLYATRVSASGQLLAKRAFALARSPSVAGVPALAAAGAGGHGGGHQR